MVDEDECSLKKIADGIEGPDVSRPTLPQRGNQGDCSHDDDDREFQEESFFVVGQYGDAVLRRSLVLEVEEGSKDEDEVGYQKIKEIVFELGGGLLLVEKGSHLVSGSL